MNTEFVTIKARDMEEIMVGICFVQIWGRNTDTTWKIQKYVASTMEGDLRGEAYKA